MTQAQKDKTISATATLVIMAIAVLICAFVGYKLPDPPIQEEGMGVAGEVLGEIEGFGNNDLADFPSETTPAPASTAPEESYTTSDQPAPVAKTDKTDKTSPTPTKPDPAKTDANSESTQTSTTPAPNSNALFPGKNNGNSTDGKGSAEGSGQAGSQTGTVGANGGTGSGSGSGYSLGGRSMRGTFPTPSYNSPKEGDVVVRIKVDRQGKVVEVEAPYQGSKNYDNSMVRSAKEAAMKAQFNADPNATEYQWGTITYKFRRVG